MAGSYPTPGPVVYIETDFLEKGEALLKGYKQSLRITETRLRMAAPYIEHIMHMSFQDQTPIGPDAWNHVGGSLVRSTSVMVGVGDQAMSDAYGPGLGGVTEQYVVQVSQDATNPYGVQYAPFVIQGHMSRGGNPVPANRYDERAVEEALPQINMILDGVAREIAEETVQYLSTYAGTVGLAG